MGLLFPALFFLGFMILKGENEQDAQRAFAAAQEAALAAPQRRRQRRMQAYVDHHAR